MPLAPRRSIHPPLLDLLIAHVSLVRYRFDCPALGMGPIWLEIRADARIRTVIPFITRDTPRDGGSDWTTYRHDPANTRNQPYEHEITTANVGQLAPKWVATTTGDVSATPAVAHGAVYFGDFGGTLWKLDADTGAVIWSHTVPDYTGIAGDYARTSPSLDGNVVVVGTNKTPLMLGVDATTGALLWKTQVHPDLHGTMTGSPMLVGDTIITGVSASGASGPGATFRGEIVALDALTGRSCGRATRCRTTAASAAAMPARRCSRRPRSTSRTGSSTARSGSRTRSRRA